jgi:hypothetical protein
LIPGLFIVSDLVREAPYREKRYGPLRAMGGPALLVSVEGAGFLDYTEAAKRYPLYERLLPAAAGGNHNAVLESCAALIANFSALAADYRRGGGENSSGESPAGEAVPLMPVKRKVYLENSEARNFGPFKGIVGP